MALLIISGFCPPVFNILSNVCTHLHDCPSCPLVFSLIIPTAALFNLPSPPSRSILPIHQEPICIKKLYKPRACKRLSKLKI